MNKLITSAYMKSETDIADTIEAKKLDKYIMKAQDRLKALLGPTFYAEIESQKITTPVSFTADNLALYDPYIKQYLAWQAYEFYIVRANTYESRSGMRVFKEESSDVASDKQMQNLITQSKNDSQFYREAVVNFLRTAQRVTPTKYPLYKNTCGSMSPGFGISAVSKTDTVNFKIDNSIVNQEP